MEYFIIDFKVKTHDLVYHTIKHKNYPVDVLFTRSPPPCPWLSRLDHPALTGVFNE